MLGSKLLASTSYHECSRNDTLLSQAYGNDEQFWQNNPLSYVNGVPGITSDSFVGEYLRKINCAFKRGPEIKENITCKDYGLIRDLMKLRRRRQRERLKRNQGSKLKKSSGRLLATNWRNVVARYKFLVASLYDVNEAAHSISLASDI